MCDTLDLVFAKDDLFLPPLLLNLTYAFSPPSLPPSPRLSAAYAQDCVSPGRPYQAGGEVSCGTRKASRVAEEREHGALFRRQAALLARLFSSIYRTEPRRVFCAFALQRAFRMRVCVYGHGCLCLVGGRGVVVGFRM